MSDPTPPPSQEPSTPPDAAPPPAVPPPASPPPAMPPQYAQPDPSPTPMARPGMVTAAGTTMIVLGALITIFGLFALLAAAFVGGAANAIDVRAPGFGNFAGAVAGVIIVFALIFLAVGILDIVAGANVLGGRAWARITGMVLAAILGLFGLAGLGNGANNGGVIGVLILAANVFIIWALATTGSWFVTRSR